MHDKLPMVIVLHLKYKEVGCSQKSKPIGNKALSHA